ncbi:fasciclin domain-containing protein [Sphingomonas sp. RB3P16]|uniref:fasciclin domain-containing protein n=1 Tax=Parasphingomonas frigoris TaxID=3096163 RepID=UPI002FCA80B2
MTFKTNLYLSAMAGALALGAAATAQTTPAAPAAPAAQMPATAAPAATAPGANPMVGGVAMDATKPIAVNASAAPNLSTLVTAVKAAGLATTLSGPGPFTVFAPTNDAFTRLAPGTVDTLLKPENKATLAKVLTYHVVPGTLTLADIQTKVKAAPGGKLSLTTVEGEPLIVELVGGGVQLTDVNGNKSYVETPDVKQSNGVVHVVNGVVLPKLG